MSLLWLAVWAHTASDLPENWRTEWRLRLCRSPVGCLPVEGNSHESFSNYIVVRTNAMRAGRCAATENVKKKYDQPRITYEERR
jgi:hypothetical protein